MMACQNCGDTGAHACIGRKPAPWTDEEKARLKAAMQRVSAETKAQFNKQIGKSLSEAFKKMGDAQEARQAKERNQ